MTEAEKSGAANAGAEPGKSDCKLLRTEKGKLAPAYMFLGPADDGYGDTITVSALQSLLSEEKKLAQYLADGGDPNVEADDSTNLTLLNLAARPSTGERADKYRLLRMLLNAKADPNQRAGEGGWPLMEDAFMRLYGCEELYCLLLEFKADPTIRGPSGKSLIESLKTGGRQDVAQIIEKHQKALESLKTPEAPPAPAPAASAADTSKGDQKAAN